MPSYARFDKWRTTSGAIVNVPLQVVTQTYNQQVATTSTSFVDIFSATIVPKADNSEFFVETVAVFNDNGRGWTANQTETEFRLYNSYTDQFISPAFGVPNGYINSGETFWGWDAELGYSQFSDEANAYLIKNIEHIGKFTGSKVGVPITLTLQWRVTGSTAYFNRTHQSSGSGAGVSTIRIMEISR